MNTKEYISSGIVEHYVLGLASEEDRAQFEQMCLQYPEVAKARTAFEKSLEDALMKDAPSAPENVKAAFLAAVSSEAPQPAVKDVIKEKPVRSLSFWRFTAAASLIIMAGSLYWGYRSHTKLSTLQQENLALNNRLNETSADLAQMRDEAATLHKPGMHMASLKGTPTMPTALATVFWDTTSKDVYLMMNNLPKPATDKQYQLWALINSQPVDLGVFEFKQEKLLVRMKGVQNAEAFAITLEPKGGSAAPTMNAMYVYGKL